MQVCMSVCIPCVYVCLSVYGSGCALCTLSTLAYDSRIQDNRRAREREKSIAKFVLSKTPSLNRPGMAGSGKVNHTGAAMYGGSGSLATPCSVLEEEEEDLPTLPTSLLPREGKVEK